MTEMGRPRTAAGLQTGMAGALVMLLWLTVAMAWSQHSVWWFPNLMATTFWGDPALQNGFDRYSAAGLALHLLQYSALGVLFAWLVPSRTSYTRLLLFGVILSLAYYYFMYGYVWRHWDPLIPLYSADRPVLVAHVFFGMMLGRLPHYAASKRAAGAVIS